MAFNGRIGHVDGIESPYSNAGGVVKTVEDVARIAVTGVGYCEDGSHTLETDRKGNAFNPETGEFDRRVYYHDAQTGLTYNSLGMPGKGMDHFEETADERIKVTHAHNKKYVLNIAPISHDPIEEARELVSRGYEAGADAVLVNGGCPNVQDTSGGNHPILSRNAGASAAVLFGLQDVVEDYKPVWYRVSPQENSNDIVKIAQGVRDSGVVSAVLLPNTWLVDIPLDEKGEKRLDIPMPKCGMSGPGTLENVLEQVAWWVKALKGTDIDVVASGGITNAFALQSALDLGAVAGAGTTFFYESHNGWTQDTDRLLAELAA